MNWIALRVWLLLFWMMAAFGIFRSSLAQQAGPATSGDKVSLITRERQWLSRHDGLIRIGNTVIPPPGVEGRWTAQGAFHRLYPPYGAQARVWLQAGAIPDMERRHPGGQGAPDRHDLRGPAEPGAPKIPFFSGPYIEVPNMIKVCRDQPVPRGILDQGLSVFTDQERRDINQCWIVVGERRVFAGTAFWIVFAVGVGVILLAGLVRTFTPESFDTFGKVDQGATFYFSLP